MSKSFEAVVLERAVALLKKGWTVGDFAVDADGKSVSCYSNEAVAFCATGAILRATKEIAGSRQIRLAYTIVRSVVVDLVGVNDERGKAEMLRLMRKRLAAL